MTDLSQQGTGFNWHARLCRRGKENRRKWNPLIKAITKQTFPKCLLSLGNWTRDPRDDCTSSPLAHLEKNPILLISYFVLQSKCLWMTIAQILIWFGFKSGQSKHKSISFFFVVVWSAAWKINNILSSDLTLLWVK